MNVASNAARTAQSPLIPTPGAPAETLHGLLRHHASRRPDRVFLRLLTEAEPRDVTFAEAWTLARRWALHLRRRELAPGAAVQIGFPNGADFVGVFFGALLAGYVPAPMMPRRGAPAAAFAGYANDRLELSGPGLVALPSAEGADAEAFDFEVITPDGLPDSPSEAVGEGDAVHPDRTALLQYTSGTSGRSKAVMLSHSALLFQAVAIARALDLDPEVDHGVSWLPFYHDMGLIGFLLTPLLVGGRVALLTTEQVMVRPGVWMEAVSGQRATITGGPPSAYVMAARYAQARRTQSLDLSCLRIALVGAERITRPAIDTILAGFKDAGLPSAALTPAYGMAEVGLAVTITPPGEGSSFLTLSRSQMRLNTAAPRALAGNPEIFEDVAACGRPVGGVDVRILSAGRAVGEHRIGDIVVRSPSLMSGYRGADPNAPSPVRDGWYHTADRGFLSDGVLYFTARADELLVVGGANYLPEEYEEAARAVTGRPGWRAVAFTCDNAQSGSESVVVVVESDCETAEQRSALATRIRSRLGERRLPVGRIVVTPPRTIKLTGNGKLPRARLRRRYLNGELGDA